MSEQKRYYWLKLKEDWFSSKQIKRLRKLAGGDTYTIIYLKMLLKSLQNDGKLYFDGVGTTFEEELALDIDEEEDNVRITMQFLINCGLLEHGEELEYVLTQADELTGSECDSAKRVREHRTRQKLLQSNPELLQCNSDVTISNTELDKEKELDLNKEKKLKSSRKTKREVYLDRIEKILLEYDFSDNVKDKIVEYFRDRKGTLVDDKIRGQLNLLARDYRTEREQLSVIQNSYNNDYGAICYEKKKQIMTSDPQMKYAVQNGETWKPRSGSSKNLSSTLL